jgi:hypothetical protein
MPRGHVNSKIHGIQLAVNKVQNDTKTTLFGVLHSAEEPSFINWLDETAKTAKPLCVGWIPTIAYKLFIFKYLHGKQMAP